MAYPVTPNCDPFDSVQGTLLSLFFFFFSYARFVDTKIYMKMIMLMRYFQSKHQLKYQSDVTKLNKIFSGSRKRQLSKRSRNRRGVSSENFLVNVLLTVTE